MMRDRKEQLRVSPSERAHDIVTGIVARHGLLQAVDIGRCIQAQLGAMVEQQKRLHPTEWPATSTCPIVQSIQTAQPTPPAVPNVPKIPAVVPQVPTNSAEFRKGTTC